MRRWTLLLAAAMVLAVVPAAGAQDGTGTIAGRVTAADGDAGIDDVCVDALPADEGAAAATTRTDAGGAYTLTVEAGLYLLAVNACEDPVDGYVGKIRGFDEDGDPYVEVTAGGTTSGVDVALAAAGTITGRVTEEGTDEPLVDVCVQSQTDASFLPAATRTGDDGTYAITTAAPGDSQVVFMDCDVPRLHTPEVYADTPVWPLSESATGDLVEVTAGGTTSGIDASLRLGGAIDGTVSLAHTGAPPTFAMVGAWAVDDTDDLPTAFAFAGMLGFGIGGTSSEPEPGRFELPGLPPDRYLLELLPTFFGGEETDAWRQRWYAGADTRADADPIDVVAGAVVDGIRMELVPTPAIEPLCAGSRADYPDVSPENAHNVAIGCMTDFGVARGGDDGRYRPAAPVRRDQMASFLARVVESRLGPAPADVPDAFSDDDGNAHEASIDHLAALGIVEGDGSGRYRPDGLVGRGQMATFLARAYEASTDATLRTPATAFRDVEGTAHATSIRKVAVAAITAGTSATTYEPNGLVARDQMASFLARLQTRLFLDSGIFASAGSSTGTTAAALTR